MITPVFQELVEYLAQTATPQQIMAFKVSDAMQERDDELLERNSDQHLTPDEQLELEQMRQFDRIVSLLKAPAAGRLKTG